MIRCVFVRASDARTGNRGDAAHCQKFPSVHTVLLRESCGQISVASVPTTASLPWQTICSSASTWGSTWVA